MYRPPRRIGDLLGSGPLLADLARRAGAVLALADQIKAALPPDLACHITGAERRQRDLWVYTDSAAFTLRVQATLYPLREQLARDTGEPVDTVNVRVQPLR